MKARTVGLDRPLDPMALVPHVGAVAWATGRRSLVGWGVAATIRPGAGDGRFEEAARALDDLFAGLDLMDEVEAWGTGPLAFGAFAFDPDSDASEIVVPAVVFGRDGENHWITTVGERGAALARDALDASPAVDLTRSPARRIASPAEDARWLEAVTEARAAVRDGILEKVVLARDARVVVPDPIDVGAVVRRLARAYPECFVFRLGGMVGATPELLVRRREGLAESVVLGGSARRGVSLEEDEALRSSLLASPKDLREHELAATAVRSGLARACGEATADEHPGIMALSYVQHLCTRMQARAPEGVGALDLAGELHPTPAVCGVPADKALAAIRELEGIDRRRYAGPVGWLDTRGDGEWGIALRCAEIAGSSARLFAGSGIVGESVPSDELAETELKLRPLLDALGAVPTPPKLGAGRPGNP